MGKRLTDAERALRAQGAPVIGAVIAYGSAEDGWRVGEVIGIDVEWPEITLEAEITLTLRNPETGHTWLLLWDSWQVDICQKLSMDNTERIKRLAV